jgi:multidrug resistance efflux pump
MVAFLTLIYAAIVVLLFKLKLVKPSPVSIACCIVAGIILLGGVVVAWTLSAPMSPRVVTTQFVIQLVPYVKGQVKKIHAQGLVPVKKGALLLEINPENYQYTVNQATAQLQSAKDNVKQSTAGLQAAQANVMKSRAGVIQARAAVDQAIAALANAQAALIHARVLDDLAKTEEQIALNLQKADAGAISELKVAKAVQNRQTKDAGVTQATAGVGEATAAKAQADAGLGVAQSAQQQAEAAERQSTFALQMANSNVTAVQAQLDNAQFDLTQCKMFAPSDGYVVNWQVQEGTMLVPMPMAAAGTFVSTADTTIAASFPQNHLMNVHPGDDVEVVLDPYPGRLFKAKVDEVIPATGEGQYMVSGQIPLASKVGSQGLLAVKIRLTDPDPPPSLPLGAGGTVAIYTTEGKPVHVISKVAIRMKKWLLYVLPS